MLQRSIWWVEKWAAKHEAFLWERLVTPKRLLLPTNCAIRHKKSGFLIPQFRCVYPAINQLL